MKPFRKERLANVIRDIVSEVLVGRLNDPRIEPLTTITRVALSGDLLIATVYLTVHGGDTSERKTLTAVRHARGFIQRIVAHELNIRQCPELRFEVDEGIRRTREVMALLQRNRLSQPRNDEPHSADPASQSEPPRERPREEHLEKLDDHGADV